MADINQQLWGHAKSLDKMVDSILPLLSYEAKKGHPIRYKVAYRLLEQVVGVAKSILKLIKITSEVELQAVDENYQSILALSRVLTESCNKFYYLAVEPKDDNELTIRWIYYSLVACVKYRKLLLSIPSLKSDPERDKIFARIEASVKRHQAELTKSGIAKWPPYLALGKNKDKGHKFQKQVRDGTTQEDYIKSDFDRALILRLNANERKHYQDLGNVAVHSSGFLLFFRENQPPKENIRFMAGAACLYLFNASRHLALCGLEMIDQFPEMETLIDAQTKIDWQTMARDLKQPKYLFN